MMFGVHASACPAALTRLEPIGRRRKVCWSRKRRIVKRGKSIGKSGSFLWRSQRLVEPGERARAGQFHEFTRISEIPDTLTIARRSRNRSSADFQVGCVAGFPTRCPYGCRWSCRLGSRRHSRFGNLRYEVRRSLSVKSSRLVTILTDSSAKNARPPQSRNAGRRVDKTRKKRFTGFLLFVLAFCASLRQNSVSVRD